LSLSLSTPIFAHKAVSATARCVTPRVVASRKQSNAILNASHIIRLIFYRAPVGVRHAIRNVSILRQTDSFVLVYPAEVWISTRVTPSSGPHVTSIDVVGETVRI